MRHYISIILAVLFLLFQQKTSAQDSTNSEYLTVSINVYDNDTGESIDDINIEVFNNGKALIKKTKTDTLPFVFTVHKMGEVNFLINDPNGNYVGCTHSISLHNYINESHYLLEIFLTPLIIDCFETPRFYFDFNSAKLDSSSYSELNYLKNLLINNPSFVIELQAYEYEDENIEVAEKRAAKCYDFLIEKGINTNRIKTKTFELPESMVDESTICAPMVSSDLRRKVRWVVLSYNFD